jgi:hypothetical protein
MKQVPVEISEKKNQTPVRGQNSREIRMHMKNSAQAGSGCIRFNDLNFHQATFAE